MKCYFCKKEIKYSGKIGFRDTCPYCSNDIHICYNCEFYEPGRYNECRETSAENVRDKERANRCDYFREKS